MSYARAASLSQYVPGIHNIGRFEAKHRQQLGSVWAAATAVLVGVLLILGAPRGLRLLAAIPATAAALGFIESALQFSMKFGLAGAFNFTSTLGRAERVVQSYFRQAEHRKATLVFAWSAALGLATAGAAFLIGL